MADNNRNRGSFYASDENWDRDESNYRRESQYEERRNINYDRDEDYSSRQGDQGQGYGGKWGRGGYSGQQQDQHYGRGQGQAGDDYRTGYGEGRWQGNERRNVDYRGGYGGQSPYGRRHEDYSMGEQGDYGSGYGSSGSYGSTYGTSSYRYGTGRGRQDYDQDYGRTSGSHGQGQDYGYGERGRDWRSQGQYEGERRRGDHDRDRDWWDKTRDEVSSWFGDEHAERRRQADHIREGQHKGKGPRDYKRSDDRIREDVCDRLSDDPYVDASDINVRVTGNEVILTGTVENREDKRRAEELAERISGVSNVQNQLRVGHVQTTVGSSEIKTDENTTGRTGKTE